MLLTFIMVIGAIPFLRKGGKSLPGELGAGMAFSLAFLLGGGYFLALCGLWNFVDFLPLCLLAFALYGIWENKKSWKESCHIAGCCIQDLIKKKDLELPPGILYWGIGILFFFYLWFLACEKELPCGWDPAFHALLAGKILKEGLLSTSWLPFENITMNYPQGSHILIALTAKYGSLCHFLPQGLFAIPQAQKIFLFALVLPSALLIWAIAQQSFQSVKVGFFAFLTYLFLGNLGTYSSFWSWGGYPTATGFLFFTALIYFALKREKMEKKDFFACTVLWGSFGLCHHMTVVIVAIILWSYTIFLLADKKPGRWEIWKRFFFPGLAACILYLPGILFQIRYAGSTANSQVFHFDDERPYTFFQFLENGSIPVVAGLVALIFLLFSGKKQEKTSIRKDFLLSWAITAFSSFLFFEVIFRYCIAIPFFGKSFSLFVPSRFLTMSALPFSILTGYLLYRIFQNVKVRKNKYIFPVFFFLALLLGCINYYKRPLGDAPSLPVRLLASELRPHLNGNPYIIVDPSKLKKTHWLPFLLWKPCITNPIPSSEDRRSVRKGLELFLYTEWEKLDLPAIRKYLKERGDQKAFWVIADENGKLIRVFQYPR